MFIRFDNGFIMYNLNFNLKRFYFFIILDENVFVDVRRIVGDGVYILFDFSELVGKLFIICYMGIENSFEDIRLRVVELVG